MKILVTGGAGFIGSHIVDRYIGLGHDIVIVDNLSTGLRENINPKAKFIEMDVNDSEIYDLLRDENIDIVNHQAAQVDVRTSVNDPLNDIKINVLGGINLYEACTKSKVKKIIFASSGGTVYGEQVMFPAREDHKLDPCSPYGINKLTNEKYLYYYKAMFGLEYVALRYGNVYGPRQNPHGEAGVVAIFLERMLNGKKCIINGDGTIKRDYVFVDDVVNANVYALEVSAIGTYNVGTAIEHDVNFIFRRLNELTGAGQEEFHGPAKKGEQLRSVLSYKRLNDEFGFIPEMKFDEGLIKTVDWFKAKNNK